VAGHLPETRQQFTARMKARRHSAHTFHSGDEALPCYLGYRLGAPK
jgi:hypothetical protein